MVSISSASQSSRSPVTHGYVSGRPVHRAALTSRPRTSTLTALRAARSISSIWNDDGPDERLMLLPGRVRMSTVGATVSSPSMTGSRRIACWLNARTASRTSESASTATTFMLITESIRASSGVRVATCPVGSSRSTLYSTFNMTLSAFLEAKAWTKPATDKSNITIAAT